MTALHDVPEPARRYLQHTISPSAVPATSLELTMTGRIRTQPDSKWMSMRAVQTLSIPGGFVWKARTGGLVRITGSDCYQNRTGSMRWRLWGLIPVIRASGPDVTRAAFGRYAMEAGLWLPHTLLPENGARWETIDEETARVTITIDSEPFPMTLRIGPAGELREATIQRWGNYKTADGRYENIPFGALCSDDFTVDGVTIPSKWRIGWRPGSDDYFEFFQAELANIRYRQ